MRKPILFLSSLTILVVGIVSASVPTVINYQGQLTDTGGNPVADGSYSVTFTIYDDPTAGSVLWSSGVRQVDVSGGLFNYILGDSVPLFNDILINDSSLWLGIQIEADPEITPRSLLTSTPKSAVSTSVYGDIKTSRGSMYIDDGTGNDSDVVISNEVSALDHHGHVTILKIANNGSDTTNMVGMYADDEFQNLYVGDDDGTDSGIVVGNSVDKHKHRGHVTILKIANNGSDTTDLVSMSATPDSQSFSMGDGTSPDSGIYLSSTASQLDHHGHVTILKIANNGSDTTNMVGMYADDEFQNLYVGDDDGTDSGIVVGTTVDKHKHHGHVTILKISNNGADTTELFGVSATPVSQSISLGESSSSDSGIVISTSADQLRHYGHVTVLKIANNGSDSTDLVTLDGQSSSPSMYVGDYTPADSGIVVSNSVDIARHRGHVTVLKISSGGADTTDILSLNGDENQASIQLNGAGGAGGSIYLLADSSADGGKIGVNNNNPTFEVDVTGTICATNGLCGPSDQRLKKDITPLNNGLSLVEALNPVRFNWRRKEFPERNFSDDSQIGFIAQEVQKILPELVSQGSDGFYALDYAKLTPVLVQALKEQQAEIKSLSGRLEQLEKMVTILTATTVANGQELGMK